MSKLVRMVYEQILKSEDPDTFATFEYRDSSEHFVQLKFDKFNAFYPSEILPKTLFSEQNIVLPLEGEFSYWEANNYMGIDFPEQEPNNIAKFVQEYCEKIFGKSISKEAVFTEVEW